MLGAWLSTGVDRLALVAAGLRGAWSIGNLGHLVKS